MMVDNRPSDHPQPMEFLNTCLGDNLQPHSEACPGETCGHLVPREPCQEHTQGFKPPESTQPDGPHNVSHVEPVHLGSFSFQEEYRHVPASPGSLGNSCPLGSPRQNPSSSTQVVFWAGILQAQMCVLDLEEELEKTEGLKAELRCCLPPPARDFPGDVSLSPSTPEEEEEDSEDDSSGPEGENQAWPRGETPGSSPEWGAEEESIFFDNPLFLDSPCSDSSAVEECFSWGFSNSHPDVRTPPDSLQALKAPHSEATGPWELESEPDLGVNIADDSGQTTPPFPVPSYKPHPCRASWAAEEPPTASPAEESEASLKDKFSFASSAAPCVDQALTWESESEHLDPAATHPVQPQNPQTSHRLSEQGQVIPESCQTKSPSWLQESLVSQDRGERDAGCSQELAHCTLAHGLCGSRSSSPEPTCSDPEGGGTGPRSSPVFFQEGRPQFQCPSPSLFPKWPLHGLHSLLPEKDGSEPSALKEEKAGDASNPGQKPKSEGTARIEEIIATQPNIHLSSADGLPESSMYQAQLPVEDQKSSAGDKLANGIRNLASRLYHLEGFRKSEVAAYLQKNNDYSRAVAEAYLSFFQFGGQNLDQALRAFLQALVLSGETQERERILYQFSKRYHYCNPGVFPSVDSVHTLTCAIMLLNTDLHGQNIGKSMSCQAFIANLNGLQDGRNFPKQLLKALYWSIRSEKLEWAMDEEDEARPEKAGPSPIAGKMNSPLLQLAQDPTVPTYKQGILARKMHQDADGKKTPWGKRGWKMFHTLLRGMGLYFLKGEDHCLEGESLVGHMVDEPVGVHHSLASPATHYTKKPHVFQLRTADWRLYLFQAPTAKEMASWIARINLAAAIHSAPPFPAAVGSQRRFVRPILPVSPAQSSLEEQHRSHENCLDAASDDLLDLQRNLPERRGRSRNLEEYRMRKEYLEYEKSRYETYVQLLVARLHCCSGDLAQWEEQLGKEGEDTREPKPSLKKSHSSPSLHQDEVPTTAKVKRNISERRTYRKIIPKRNRNQLRS